MSAFARMCVAAALVAVLVPTAAYLVTWAQMAAVAAIVIAYGWAVHAARREAVDIFADALSEAVRQKRGAR
jgi:endonuclease YncB( thermonuclease family)